MCELYRMTKAQAVIAWLFGVSAEMHSTVGEEVYPGSPGLVVEGGRLRKMAWGFPYAERSERAGEFLKPRPINHAGSDELDSFMWHGSFASRRCLIPITAWAEAEGQRGSQTRTWMSLPDLDVFAVAGIWRDSVEWGPCYSMVMTDAAGEVAQVHRRMPVILMPDQYDLWCDGSAIEAKMVCRPWRDDVSIDRTKDLWVQ